MTTDKGYVWEKLRRRLRNNGLRAVIQHREFDSLDRAHYTRFDDSVYHQRLIVETVFSMIKRRYGNRLRARTWYAPFRETVLKADIKNIEAAVKA